MTAVATAEMASVARLVAIVARGSPPPL